MLCAKVCSSCRSSKKTNIRATDPIPANNEKVLEVPVGQVLWVQVSDGNIEVHLLARKKVNAVQLTLVNVNGKVHPEDVAAAPEWAEQIMKQAYAGAPLSLCLCLACV
jgi:hypothetical protein